MAFATSFQSKVTSEIVAEQFTKGGEIGSASVIFCVKGSDSQPFSVTVKLIVAVPVPALAKEMS